MNQYLFCFGRVAFGKATEMTEEQFTSPVHVISLLLYSKIRVSTADCNLCLGMLPASFGVPLLLCSGSDYSEQGCYSFIMFWKEVSLLPVIHINSVD